MPIFKSSKPSFGRFYPTSPLRPSSRSSSSSAIDDFQEELDGLVIPPTDEEPEFYPRPTNAGKTYLEDMGDERADQQVDLFEADGESTSRPHQEEQAANEDAATHEEFLIDTHAPVVTLAWEKYFALVTVLAGLVRRSPKEKAFYLGRMVLLMLGDVVGVAGGAIVLGEVPWLAVLQATAAAVAAVTSGLLGSEIKDARLARKRKRDPKSLTEAEKPFAHLFQGPDAGEYIVKLMAFGSLSIVVFLGIGIFMLRTSTEGAAAGVVFGCIAMAVAVASWINTFHYTDELADLLETSEISAKSSTSFHQELTAAPARSIVAREQASVQSIQKEAKARGQAAAHQVRAMVLARLVGQVSIVGHGYASQAGASQPETKSETETDAAASTAASSDEPVDLRTTPTNGNHPEPESVTAP
jgi:hypothetical protein